MRSREKLTLDAAALTTGPADLMDFLLPLWVGSTLGASPTQVGILIAVETALSFLARPLAGVLADWRDRRRLAALGAVLYGISCAGYAVAASFEVALIAAAVGGIGGSLLWVPLRALVGERLSEDSSVFAQLESAEGDGAWIAYVVAVGGFSVLGYTGAFWLAAASCLAGAALLLAAPRGSRPTDARPAVPMRAVGRKLRPMLLAVGVTELAETGIAVLMLMQLQREFELELQAIAFVFLPGAIALAVLPPYLHRVVKRIGRRIVLAGASVASAAFAASLAFAPSPVAIAVLWVLAAAAWAAAQPIQQAVITEASGGSEGRGMGLFESAGLAGATVGSVIAGIAYEQGGWIASCLTFAAIILAGCALVPAAVGRLGVPDRPEN